MSHFIKGIGRRPREADTHTPSGWGWSRDHGGRSEPARKAQLHSTLLRQSLPSPLPAAIPFFLYQTLLEKAENATSPGDLFHSPHPAPLQFSRAGCRLV